MSKRAFPYSPWTKRLGLLIILVGIISFFLRYRKHEVYDFNELAIGICFGFFFIFFSKEKKDDEMIHQLKFKALARAVIFTFFLTHLYNYLFLNWRFERDKDMILSISAYQFLAVTLVIATGLFYWQKRQAVLSGNE